MKLRNMRLIVISDNDIYYSAIQFTFVSLNNCWGFFDGVAIEVGRQNK